MLHFKVSFTENIRFEINHISNHMLQPVPQKPQYEAPPTYYEPHRPQQDFAAEEAYWSRRIEGLKRAHEKINSTMQLEYQKALKDAQQLYDMANDDKVTGSLPPCQEEKAKVLCTMITSFILH